MRDKKRIERDIKATKTCITNYQTDLTEYEKELAKYEKELAELDKPVLRHGDYGFSKSNQACMSLLLHDGCGTTLGEGRAGDTYAYNAPITGVSNFLVKTKLGNIFDDLKALSQPLEEFEVAALNVKSGFKAKIMPANRINLGGSYDTWEFSIKQVEEIILNLRRLIATAKSK